MGVEKGGDGDNMETLRHTSPTLVGRRVSSSDHVLQALEKRHRTVRPLITDDSHSGTPKPNCGVSGEVWPQSRDRSLPCAAITEVSTLLPTLVSMSPPIWYHSVEKLAMTADARRRRGASPILALVPSRQETAPTSQSSSPVGTIRPTSRRTLPTGHRVRSPGRCGT